ncbi:FmdB family zinc ribbon protein [Marihabitans asiaticum]|uniref:FmdB family zinc ribbon protein n=1 Tax=Marihabitans asiaticum TaxID=415218 RepID=UPI0011A04FF3|nr:FmdB family zinc ribbon protein [Marihabitans asiaticum]
MPTYAYGCTECGHEFDAVQSFSEDSLTQCPECGGALRKKFGAVGVVFKGGGFYKTDSRSTTGSGSSSTSSGGSSSSADAGSGSGSGKDSGASSSASTGSTTGSGTASGSTSSGTGSSGSAGVTT